jgi:hypothetical protein
MLPRHRQRQAPRALTVLAAFAACATAGCQPRGAAMSSIIQVSVRVEPSAVPSGGALTVVATARNAAKADTVLRFRSSCRFSLQIVDASGKGVFRPFPMCLQVLGEERLAPGGEVTEKFVLGRPAGDPWAVLPGEYRVRVSLLAEGDTATMVGESPLTVTGAGKKP